MLASAELAVPVELHMLAGLAVLYLVKDPHQIKQTLPGAGAGDKLAVLTVLALYLVKVRHQIMQAVLGDGRAGGAGACTFCVSPLTVHNKKRIFFLIIIKAKAFN